MPRRRNPVLRHLVYGLTYAFFRFTQRLPLSLSRRIGLFLADVAYHVVPRVRTTGLANINLAYGDTLSPEEKKRILRDSVHNLGLVAAEFAHVTRLLTEGFAPFVTVKGFENVDQSKGGVLLGAHHGNWEWMLPVSHMLGLNAAAIVRPFDDPRMDALVYGVRRESGLKIIPKNNAMGTLLRELREGAQVGLLADQNPRENAVPVTFFGQPTWATIGAAMLAMRAKAPIYPISMVRTEEGTYLFEFHPALDLVYTGNMMDDLRANTQRCMDALEAIIRKDPGQWLWLHRRWKRRERLEREWAAREKKASMKRNAEPPQGTDGSA